MDVLIGSIVSSSSGLTFMWYLLCVVCLIQSVRDGPTFVLLTSQGICDLCALLQYFIFGLEITFERKFIVLPRKWQSLALSFLEYVALPHYVVIAANRATAVFVPTRVNEFWTTRRTIKISILTWLAAIISITSLHLASDDAEPGFYVDVPRRYLLGSRVNEIFVRTFFEAYILGSKIFCFTVTIALYIATILRSNYVLRKTRRIQTSTSTPVNSGLSMESRLTAICVSNFLPSLIAVILAMSWTDTNKYTNFTFTMLGILDHSIDSFALPAFSTVIRARFFNIPYTFLGLCGIKKIVNSLKNNTLCLCVGIPVSGNSLQVVHPPAPKEQDWVLTAGNESAIDNVLSISLMYGGRLVSMGYYYRNREIHYYAIMHKFRGPVFLKPNPMSYADLLLRVKENEERDLALTQVCGQESPDGQVTFTTYWEKVPGARSEVWFPGSSNAEAQKLRLEREGFRLSYLCGYAVRNRAEYVGVWQKPTLSINPYEAHYGLSLADCLRKDKQLKSKGFVATQFRVFNNGNAVICTAIWEYSPRKYHSVEVGENLQLMYRRFARDSEMLPRQISHFFEGAQLRYVVLWTNYNTSRYPDPSELWKQNETIPVRFLKGTPELLRDDQIDFIVARVQHFMKDLNIPGLSVAISKKEQLKFAAGFGYANIRRKEVVTPHHQFRVGSVSKPITAAAIMLLVDARKLSLDQKIFGKNSIFGMEFAKKRLYGKYVTEVTVRHLLEHTSGGWNNLESDAAWMEPDLSTRELIEHVIENVPLTKQPGTTWIYSNFGYQLLGYIVERLSNLDYEQFVKDQIWSKVGVTDIQVARPTIAQRTRREVLYYMSGNKLGFDPYTMLRPERIGPWGGWIASPIELLQFMAHFDGFSRKTDLITERSVEEWATPSKASNGTYGLGWSLNVMGFSGWQHDGRMPGSAAMLVRLRNGLEMAVSVNKEYSERDFFHELGYVLHHIGNNCDWWNETMHDLFPSTSIF
ncbi:hypothetical protein QR680_001396 [Steinernema hermaphroditum]|uniref:Beta-lactamase-related domain-containing protein n=1 Tax=Steinernema hermaphroditum TaxID=289476 RepID=A0AA39GYW5_9BILA|nr:hypothetical protein QR680_001396 [Steinernema hermaphroditum]